MPQSKNSLILGTNQLVAAVSRCLVVSFILKVAAVSSLSRGRKQSGVVLWRQREMATILSEDCVMLINNAGILFIFSPLTIKQQQEIMWQQLGKLLSSMTWMRIFLV